jgi:hypothetical protein
MTEDEAKTKWCPMARQIHSGEIDLPPHNRSRYGWEMCVASACMMWRQDRQTTENLIEAIKRYRTETGAGLFDAKTYVENHPEYARSSDVGGFCGLAGHP